MSGTVIVLMLSFLSVCRSSPDYQEVDVSGTALSTTIDDYNGIDTMITCEHPMLTRYLKSLAELNSDLVELRSIGNSTKGKELWNAVITFNKENVGRKKQIKFVGNINGFSGPACVILVRFAKYLVDEARRVDKKADLLRWGEVHIVPNLNPDGYEKSKIGDCDSSAGWKSGEGIKLNRNFPSPYTSPDANEFEDNDMVGAEETLAVRRWIGENDFVISASLISGTKALIYPYDMAPNSVPKGEAFPVPRPDDVTFVQICEDYTDLVDQNSGLTYVWDCPNDKPGRRLKCINGAKYGRAEGTMADYNYEEGVLELTIGLDCCRNLNNSIALENVYNAHIEGLFGIVIDGVLSVRMRVVDSKKTDVSLRGATLRIVPLRDIQGVGARSFIAKNGVFARMLPPGEYKIEVSLQGYENKEINLTIPEEAKLEEFDAIEVDKIRRNFGNGRRVGGSRSISVQTQEAKEARDSGRGEEKGGGAEDFSRGHWNRQETASSCGQLLAELWLVVNFAAQTFLGMYRGMW